MSHPSGADFVLPPPYSGERPPYALGMALSPDGSALAVLYSLSNQPRKEEGRVRVWSLADRGVRSIPLPKSMDGLCWPHPELLVAGTAAGAWVIPLDGSDGRHLPMGTYNTVSAVASLPGGREFVIFSRSVITMDVERGKLTETEGKTWELPYEVVVSPGGDLVATRAAEAYVRVFSRSTRTQLHRIHCSGSCASAFLPDGRLVVGANALGRLEILDLASGRLEPVAVVQGADHTSELAVSPDGRLLAGAWSQGRTHVGIRIWDLPGGTLRWERTWGGEALRNLRFTTAGGTLLAAVQFEGEVLGWRT